MDTADLGTATFADRLRAETIANRGAVTTWGFVTAYSRVPDP